MKTGSRSNIVLVELLIVILFFMLGSTLVMKKKKKAFSLSHKAGVEAQSVTEAQNLADMMMAENNWDEALESFGYSRMEGYAGTEEQAWRPESTAGAEKEHGWHTISGEIYIRLCWSEKKTKAGVLLDGQISIQRGEEVLISIPCVKYLPDGDI